MSASAQGWSSRISGKFDSIAQRLEEATAKAGVAWEGAAAEAHGNSMAPLSSFVRDAKEVSTAVGTSTEHQVDNYTAVRDSMPEPKKVTATDSLLEKGGAALFGTETDLQRQEQEALERAQEAQRIYGNYDTGSGNVSSSLPRYPEAPKLQYSDRSGGGGGRVGVDAGGGYTGSNISSGDGTYSGGGSRSAGNGSGVNWSGGGTGSASGSGSGSGGSSGGSDGPPAGSDSAWATPPPATGTPAPVPHGTGTGTGTAGPGGGAGGVIGGGTGGGRGGPGSGRGGSGSGYSRGGSGSGVGGRSGPGSGSGLGAGGRSGPGLGTGGRSGMSATSSTYSSTSSSGARGGMMGGAGARGAQGDDDEEHENKYMVDTDEAWEDLDLPRTAPPVIGGDLEPSQR